MKTGREARGEQHRACLTRNQREGREGQMALVSVGRPGGRPCVEERRKDGGHLTLHRELRELERAWQRLGRCGELGGGYGRRRRAKEDVVHRVVERH